MKLEMGSKGEEVKLMQTYLTKLGYDPQGIDGIFGNNTLSALKKFQTDYYVTGICDDKVFNDLANLYNQKIQEEQKQNKGYRKIRMFDSDIHIYETSPDEYVDVTLGVENKLEKLSKIDDPNVEEICKINCGFFNFDGSREHLGLFIRNGKLYYQPDNTYINFLYFKDGRTNIKYYDNNYEEIRYWLKELNWGIGCGWSLVRNGKIDVQGDKFFDRSSARHPRTLIAQKKTGEFLLIVVDGRNKNSKGINTSQAAQLAIELNVWNCCMLDGGGSSEMIVNNKIVNKPSDGVERSIGSAIVVYKRS